MSADRDEQDLELETSGESVELARRSALSLLGVRFPGLAERSVTFEEIEGDGDGARVKARVDIDSWHDDADADLPEDPAQRLRAIITRVVQELGLQAEVSIEDDDEELRATVEGDDDELGLLIGKHGQTIDALQHLAMRMTLRGSGDRKRIVVDAAGYRARREAALERSADQAVADAVRLGRPVELEPMRAPERRVVHMYLRERTEVETHSEGDEPERRLVVTPVASGS